MKRIMRRDAFVVLFFTREICLLFVGRTLNGQPLLEFPMSSGEPALEPLRIKRATLWTRVEFRHGHHYQRNRQSQTNQRNITLWVFRVRCGNTTHLRGKVTLTNFLFFRNNYTQLYIVTDNNGRIIIGEEHFRPTRVNLIAL